MDQFIANLPVPYLSQFDPSVTDQSDACGPSSVAMVLNFLSDNVDEATIFQLSGAVKGQPIAVSNLITAVQARGFTCEYKTGLSSTDLQNYLNQGIPAIMLLHAGDLSSRQDQNFTGGHFLVVDGYRADGYTCNDPDFYGNERSQGDHHFYTLLDLETAWGDCSRDGNPNNSLLIIYPKQPPVDYKALFNQKTQECNINWNSFTEVLSKLGINADPANKPQAVQQAIDKITGYINEIALLNKNAQFYDQICDYLLLPRGSDISEVKKKFDDAKQMYQDAETDAAKYSDQASQVANTLQAVKTDDTNTAKRNLVLSQTNSTLQGNMQTIAIALGTQAVVTNILSAIDDLKTALKQTQDANQQTVKQAQNLFQTLINIFWKKKKS